MGASDGAVERALGAEQAESLVALSAEAGWNQVAADWRFMLGHGNGIGMADENGAWVASALALPLAQNLAWISMVLTTKAWRGRGVGTQLLRRCVDLVRGRGVTAGLRIRRIGASDLHAVAAYDAPRSAMERGAILAHLRGRAPYLAFVAEAGDDIVGFVLGRDGRIAHHLGPIVAENEEIALALAAQAGIAAAPPFILDVPDRHAGTRRWLEASGAVSPRGFTRMVLGEAPGLEANAHVFAIGGPELG